MTDSEKYLEISTHCVRNMDNRLLGLHYHIEIQNNMYEYFSLVYEKRVVTT